MRRRTFRAEKEFGLIVGGVFVLLGLWWLYRGKFATAAYVLSAAGSILVLCGLVFPRGLTVPRRLWMKLAEAMSFVSSRIILAIIFFLVMTPIGLVKRATGWDPLQRRSATGDSFWQPYPKRDPRHYEKMY
ncbi:MAG TPA: SxtJ family membrane protein [Pyrinomonadaceae bacterium]